MNFSEEVYYSLTGDLIEPVAGVEDAFAEGTLCAKSYQNIYDAYPLKQTRIIRT